MRNSYIFFIRVFKELREKEFFASTAFITLMVLVLINVINIDNLIAQKYQPTVNGEAADSWKESIEYAQNTVIRLENLSELSPEDNRQLYWASRTIEQLKSKITGLREKNTWQTFNFSEYQAYRFVTENKEEFDKISSLSDRMAKLQAKVSVEIQRNTQLDRSTNPPLLR